MADIIIVRHGNTAWNRTERFRGLVDISLDETGRREAKATAKRIATMPVSSIFSSPIGRAMETAQIIADQINLKVNKLDELKDIDFGEFEGLSFEEAEMKHDDIFHHWLSAPHQVKFPGGESLTEVRERVSGTVENLIDSISTETIVLVSHKVVIIELILHFLSLHDSQFRQIEQDTCAINIFQKQNGRFYAMLLNDTCHLHELVQV